MIFFYQKSISWYLSCRNLSVTSCPLQTDSSGSSPVSSRHFVSNPHMNEKKFKDKTKMVNLISFWQARPKGNYGDARYLSGVQLVISMNMTRIIKSTLKIINFHIFYIAP